MTGLIFQKDQFALLGKGWKRLVSMFLYVSMYYLGER